jgi:hypothetical protein
LYEAFRSLGHQHERSLELERNDDGEDHAEYALERRQLGQVEGVR